MKHLLVFLSLCTSLVYSQKEYPQDYFDNPLNIPLILSGNFGELRSNHFHSGLDIKTQQRTGLPVYAAADGYVERINVSHYGYGKALYIKHPNGYSTVYAHLENYAGAIQDFVKSKQYEKEAYVVEMFPDANQLAVKKGDLIAYTGNSGSSGGPHLHFEIRDAASRPMNPMLFGIEIPDQRKPLINGLFAYPISENAQINGSQNMQKIDLMLQQDGSFTTNPVKLNGKIGFGINVSDQQDGASNKNGAYIIKSIFNGSSVFEVRFNKFSFDETRYLNRYIDYGYFELNKSRIQKLFRQPNNPLSVITSEVNEGYVDIPEGMNGTYTIDVSDFKGNKATINVPVIGIKDSIIDPKVLQETDDFIVSNQGNSLTKGKFSIYIPSDALYEDTYLDIKAHGDTLDFHRDIIPIHKNITITIDISEYKEDDIQKLYIGEVKKRGAPSYYTTSREGNKLSVKTRTFGSYCLASDYDVPSIKPLNFSDGQWISSNNTLEIKIEDATSGIKSYYATVNGQFILMEYDYKKDLLLHDFSDGKVTDTENKFKLIVVDNVGNSATFEATFFRKTL